MLLAKAVPYCYLLLQLINKCILGPCYMGKCHKV